MLLASQEQTFRCAVDLITKQLHEKINSLEVTVKDATRSLEYTQKEVEDLKQRVSHHEREESKNREIIGKLKQDLQVSGKLVHDLEERCNMQEDYSRGLNLQFIGVDELPGGETWEQTADRVSNLLKDKFELPNIELERAHRVGRGVDQRTRPIIACFARYCDREAVMRNVSKLKGTNIYVNEDLCPASLAIKKAQIPEMKQARRNGKVAYFRHTKLIIKDRVRAPARGVGAAGGSAAASFAAAASGASTSHVTIGGDDVSSATFPTVEVVRGSNPASTETPGRGGGGVGEDENCATPAGTLGRDGDDGAGDGSSQGSVTCMDTAGVRRPVDAAVGRGSSGKAVDESKSAAASATAAGTPTVASGGGRKGASSTTSSSPAGGSVAVGHGTAAQRSTRASSQGQKRR